MRGFVVVLFSLFASAQALAFTNKHEYFVRSRPVYGQNVYLSQQAQYASGKYSLTGKKNSSFKSSGYSLQSSLGAEFQRFLQVGVYYANVQDTSVKTSSQELHSHEGGAEAKVVLSTPVVNINVRGSLFVSKNTLAMGERRMNLAGDGYSYGADLSMFVASNVTLIAGVTQVKMTAKDSSQSGEVTKVSGDSTRVGAGVSLWL